MVSTFGSLNTVVTGLQAQQLSLNTTGHNIANVDRSDYSRQRVNLVASIAQTIYTNGGPAQLGMGVTSQSIIRIRDTFIDRQYWKENSILATNQTKLTYLNKIEDVFGEPKSTGLASLLNNFWDSLNNLHKDASNHPARAVAIQNGVSLCTAIQQETTQLKNMVSDINVMVGLRVNSINQITEELLTLNKKISSVEAGKMDNANDLRDRRDYLVDQLAYMIDVQVTEDKDGNYIVYGAGVNLVTEGTRQVLETQSRTDPDYGYEIVEIINPRTKDPITSLGTPITFKNGEIAALMTSRDSEESGIKKYLNDLANMAKFLLQEFNDVHKAGVDLNGDAGGNFFGKAPIIYNDPAHSDPTDPNYFTKGDWLAHLQVSSELTNPDTGTYKLAARTLLGEAQQGNPQSGHAILGWSDSTVTAEDVVAAYYAAYPGKEIVITIDGVDDGTGITGEKGTVLGIKCTIDGVDVTIAGSITATPTDNGSIIFKIDDGVTVPPLTIQIARSFKNTDGSTYTFTIPKEPQGIGAGDNVVNLCNRLKEDISETIGNVSMDTYYNTQMGVLGAQAKNAESMTDNQQAIIDQLLMLRASVSGVNQEEELTDMVRFQKAYNSAARILTAMDEMLDKLVNGTGRVGL